MPYITVCTATYNFEKYLHRIYESLQQQTYKDFEWVVVDDASEDGTEELIQSWIANNDFFSINYIKLPENRGKMHATNQGVLVAEGYFFLDIGGDDALKPYALEHFVTKWEEIDEDLKPQLAGMVTNREDQHGNMVGTHFPQDTLVCDYFERMFKYRIKGDKCELYKTEVMREFPFYDKVDRHVIHSATFFDMAYKYKLYCFEDSLYIYWMYEEDKLTLSKRTHKLRFLKGRQFYAERRINVYFNRIPSLKFKFLTFISYIRYSAHIGLSYGEMLRRIEKFRYKLAYVMILPFGWGLVRSDRRKKRV